MKVIPTLFLGAQFNREYEAKLNSFRDAITNMAPEDSVTIQQRELVRQIRVSVQQAYKLGLKAGEKRNA